MAADKEHQRFDVVVVGGGPAGLTAALYAARARRSTLLVEKGLLGGLATSTSSVCNYPGFPEEVGGLELMRRFEAQARNAGVVVKTTPVKALRLAGPDKQIETFRTVYHAGAVVLATGGRPRLAGAAGEEAFLHGRGLSFCAACDAAACEGKPVLVVGSGDAALEEAVFLARFASHVVLSVRRGPGELRAGAAAQEAALSHPRLAFRWRTVVHALTGGERLEAAVLRHLDTGALETVPVGHCFYFVGHQPASDLFRGQLALSEAGYVLTDGCMRTTEPGVFAAGDVRDTPLRQIATAVGDGAVAGAEADRFLAAAERAAAPADVAIAAQLVEAPCPSPPAPSLSR